MSDFDAGPTGEDITIVCPDCGRDFEFTTDEQEFYFERGLRQPKRCKSCRTQRKSQFSQRPR